MSAVPRPPQLPLWYQVTEALRARILTRSPGDPLRLPTEARLAAEYGVAVSTIRQALTTLEAEGLITRRRRHGTFIADDAPAHPPSHAENHLRTEHARHITEADLRTAPMTKLLRDQAMVPIARIDNTLEACAASPRIAPLLEIPLASPVLRSTNLVYDTDGKVVDAAVIHYRADRFQYTVS